MNLLRRLFRPPRQINAASAKVDELVYLFNYRKHYAPVLESPDTPSRDTAGTARERSATRYELDTLGPAGTLWVRLWFAKCADTFTAGAAMKTASRIVVVVTALTAVACAKRAPSTYDIGVVAPFTGQEGATVYGHNIKNAVEMAVDEINAAGGVRGRRLVPRYEDDQLLAPVAVAAIQKLATVDHVRVIVGPVASSSTMAAARVADQDSVILISPSSTAHEISGISRFVFRTIAPDTYEGEVMARYALQKGYGRFAVAFVDNAGTRGPAEVFRSAVEAGGARVLAFEVVPQGSTNARSQMTRLVSTKPDAVYLLGYALELGSMIRQFREQDRTTPILSFQVMEEPKVREIAGASANGVVFTSPSLSTSTAAGTALEFIKRYRARYGEDPGIFGANAYDAVRVVASVINSRGVDVAEIADGLRHVRDFDGASGTFSIDDKGDSNQQPRLMVVSDGSLQPLEDSSRRTQGSTGKSGSGQ